MGFIGVELLPSGGDPVTAKIYEIMDSVDNIFKYVIPKTISVPKAKKRVVAIMCNFKFDMEHGMAIVFEDEKIKKIGPQDIVL